MGTVHCDPLHQLVFWCHVLRVIHVEEVEHLVVSSIEKTTTQQLAFLLFSNVLVQCRPRLSTLDPMAERMLEQAVELGVYYIGCCNDPARIATQTL